jgi:hypothetical protein
VNWHDKIGVKLQAAQDAANETLARQIFNEVKNAINNLL